MQIAAFIKNKKTKELLSQFLKLYTEQRGALLSCHFFDSELNLLGGFVQGQYDAIFFDGQHNDTVDKLFQEDNHLRLIYIANTDMNTDTLPTNLWYCLPNSLDSLFLFPALDRLSSELQKEENAGMIIKIKGTVIRLPFSQIEYVEVLGRRVIFRLTDGRTEEVVGTLSDYESRLLMWPDFVKVHRAYLCNLRHIVKLTSESLITSSGYTVPISKLLYSQVRKYYLNDLLLPENEPSEPSEPSPTSPPSSSLNPRYTLLLVDDEEVERLRWSKVLTDNGCLVHTADNPHLALAIARSESIDCIILDVNLGESCGFDLCSMLHEHTDAPIIFLSSLSDSAHQEKGFLTGGIDYITKDTSKELFWLKVEMRMLMAKSQRSEIAIGGLCLDLRERKASLYLKVLPLTTVEFDILYLLMQNPDTTYAPEKLYELIWSNKRNDSGHTVQLHISQLYNKLEQVSNHRFIQSVWGEGYRFVPE